MTPQEIYKKKVQQFYELHGVLGVLKSIKSGDLTIEKISDYRLSLIEIGRSKETSDQVTYACLGALKYIDAIAKTGDLKREDVEANLAECEADRDKLGEELLAASDVKDGVATQKKVLTKKIIK